MRFSIDVPPDLWLSANRTVTNHHKRRRIIDDLHTLAAWQARAQHAESFPVLSDVLWIIQYPKGVGVADPDNAYPTCKAILDALVQAGYVPDDGTKFIRRRSYERGPNLTVQHIHRVTLAATPHQEGAHDVS